MTRIGVNVLLVGVLFVGLGAALGPFLVALTPFESPILYFWVIGAALVLAGALVAAFGKAASRS